MCGREREREREQQTNEHSDSDETHRKQWNTECLTETLEGRMARSLR